VDDLLRAMLVLTGQFDPTPYSGAADLHDSSIVMFRLPGDVARRVIDFGIWAVPDMELYADQENSIPGREYDQHITIKYGLKTDNPLDVLNVIERRPITPFEITLGKVDIFEKDLYDVVMVEITDNGLLALHEALLADLPNEETYPKYHPHVTVAYVKKGMGLAHVGAEDFAGLKIVVDRVTFTARSRRETTIPLYGVQL
jgi:2'-5' RNA ligase